MPQPLPPCLALSYSSALLSSLQGLRAPSYSEEQGSLAAPKKGNRPSGGEQKEDFHPKLLVTLEF